MNALHRKLLRDLWLMKGQVVTIALVVASGIASLVALQSTFRSLQRSLTAYYERQRMPDVFAQLERAPDAVAAQLEEIPGVARAYVRVVETVRVPISARGQPPIGQIVSIPDDGDPPLAGLFLERGRLPDPTRENEALLLRKFADSHGIEPGDTLPVVVEGRRLELEIVGIALSPEFVYPMLPGSVAPDDERFAVLWMVRDRIAPALDLDGAFNDVVLELQPGANEAAVLDELDRVLEPWGGRGAVPRALQGSHYVLHGEIEGLRSWTTVVPTIFLGVAAFLLNVVLSRLVLLQRTQIASLEALGYSRRQVAAHYLQMLSVVVLLGAVVGVALGAWLGGLMTGLYTRVFGFPQPEYRVGLDVVVTGIGVSLASAAIGAFAALRQVMRLPPAEAMRPPSPATYRPSLLERAGLGRLVGGTGRMVLRELGRHPARTLLSTVGIAMSVAILVVGRFNIDTVNYLIEHQFHRVSREDLSVSFVSPRPPRVLTELKAMPGVLRAEGMRSVPVRFVAGPRSRDSVLMGHDDDTTLFRVLDAAGREMPLPSGGVVLTNKLADILQVRPGDPIEVRVREGEWSTLHLHVSGVVDEMIGLQGHMRLDDLADALGETPSVSTALLSIDPLQEEAIVTRLSDAPQVLAITSRHATLRRFHEQMQKTMLFITGVMTLFAATIAVGVVYNNARVALSVRSRDLASLRVLGFTRREIGTILLSELAVQVLLAIPLGLLTGRWLAYLIVVTNPQAERIRLPLVISSRTDAFAALITLLAGLLSALLVRRQLARLDLIGVLKTGE